MFTDMLLQNIFTILFSNRLCWLYQQPCDILRYHPSIPYKLTCMDVRTKHTLMTINCESRNKNYKRLCTLASFLYHGCARMAVSLFSKHRTRRWSHIEASRASDACEGKNFLISGRELAATSQKAGCFHMMHYQ